MKARVTKKDGWVAKIRGKQVLVPEKAILNGDLADEAMAAGVAEQAPFSMKITPIEAFKPVEKKKKALGAAPENKAGDA